MPLPPATRGAALRRGEEFKNASKKRIFELSKELQETQSLTGQYYSELQNAKSLLGVVAWSEKTKVVAAKPRAIKVLPPSNVVPHQHDNWKAKVTTMVTLASLSPELKRMLGL